MSRRNEGRFPMSLRVSPETYMRIADAAAASGRSLAQEMETRLEASFHDDDAMRVIRETIRQEMRAEFAGREQARVQMQYSAPTQFYQGFSQFPAQDWSNQHGQQYLQARNQYHGNYMALKTEPEKVLKFAQQSVAYANQGQQWSAAAVNQSAQQWHGCANFDQTANQYSLSAKFSPKKDG